MFLNTKLLVKCLPSFIPHSLIGLTSSTERKVKVLVDTFGISNSQKINRSTPYFLRDLVQFGNGSLTKEHI